MARQAQIELEGFRELRAAVRKYETDTRWQTVFKPAFSGVATAMETAARASASSSRMGSQARNSIKGKGTQTAATLKAGQGVPWFMGHNFGSLRYRQFPVKTTPDYHLYRTIEKERENIQRQFLEAIDAGFVADGLA
jgi:hypothetical protein